jgi:acetyl esterase/lipase
VKMMDELKQRIAAKTSAWAKGAALQQIRGDFDAFFGGLHPGAAARRFEIAHMPAAAITTPSSSAGRTVLYCHGGGFQVGSIQSHLSIASRLAEASMSQVIVFEYRLAPEHRFPAAVEDSLAAYRWLHDNALERSKIAIAGDSAGASLALTAGLQARDLGLRSPSCLALISPWLDLSLRSDSYSRLADADVFSTPKQLAAMARTYVGRGGDLLHPLASPVEAGLGGLPPILVHAGASDITLGDAGLLVQRAAAAGVEITLQVWSDMFHHFQMFAELPQAAESLAYIGKFIIDHTG